MRVTVLRLTSIRRAATRLAVVLLLLASVLQMRAETLEEFLQPHVQEGIRQSRAKLSRLPPLDRKHFVESASELSETPLSPLDVLAASEPLLKANPADDDVLFACARAWQALGQPLRALETLDRLSPTFTNDWVRYTRALALRSRGLVSAAVVQLDAVTKGGFWSASTDPLLAKLTAETAEWQRSLRPHLLRPKAPVPAPAFAVARSVGAQDVAFALARLQLAANPADAEALQTLAWVCATGFDSPRHAAIVESALAPQLAAAARLQLADAETWKIAVRAGAARLVPGGAAELAVQSALLAEARQAGHAFPNEEFQVQLFSTPDLPALLALEADAKARATREPTPLIHWNRMRLFHSPGGPALEAAIKTPSDATAWSRALVAVRAEVLDGRIAPPVYRAILDEATDAGHHFPEEERYAKLLGATESLELIAAIRDALPAASNDVALRETIARLVATRLALPPENPGVTRELRVTTPPRFTEDFALTPEEIAVIKALPTPLERAQAWARHRYPAEALAELGPESPTEDFVTARLRVVLLQLQGRLNDALLALDRAVWRLRDDPESAKFPWAGLRQEFEAMHTQVAQAEAALVRDDSADNWARLATAWTQQPCPSYLKARLAAAQAIKRDEVHREAKLAELTATLDLFQGLPKSRFAPDQEGKPVPAGVRLEQMLYHVPGSTGYAMSLSILRELPPNQRVRVATSWLRIDEIPGVIHREGREDYLRAVKAYRAKTRAELEAAELELSTLPANSPYAPDLAYIRRAVDSAWAKEGLLRTETTLFSREQIAQRNQLADDQMALLEVAEFQTEKLSDPAEIAKAWRGVAEIAWGTYERLRLLSVRAFAEQIKNLPNAAERENLTRILTTQQPFGPDTATPEIRAGNRLVAATLTLAERKAAADCVRLLCTAYTHLNHARLGTTALQLLRTQHVRVAEVEEAQARLAQIDTSGDYADFPTEFDAIIEHINARRYAEAQAVLNQIAPRAAGNPYVTLFAASIANDTDRDDAYRLLIAMPNDYLKITALKERYLRLDRAISNRRDYVRAQRTARQQEIRQRLAAIRREMEGMNARINANTDRLRGLTESMSTTSFAQLSSRKDEADRLDASTAIWADSARRLAAEANLLAEELSRLERR
jgi:hypothetical protein